MIAGPPCVLEQARDLALGPSCRASRRSAVADAERRVSIAQAVAERRRHFPHRPPDFHAAMRSRSETVSSIILRKALMSSSDTVHRSTIAKHRLYAKPAPPPVFPCTRCLGRPFLGAPITAVRRVSAADRPSIPRTAPVTGFRPTPWQGRALHPCGPRASADSSAMAQASGPSGPHGTLRKPSARMCLVGSQNSHAQPPL